MGKTEKIKILYIDDEVNNLNAFKATFRFDYTIFIALNGKDAYSHLENNPDIRVVISDQRMPEQTGAQFFEEMREQFPAPVRMLITGYSDIEDVVSAVNMGHIFRYIKKPWTDADVKSAIEEANTYYSANSMLAAKNRELQVAYDELGKFTYSITHDIRGPLLSVLGALDIAKSMDNFKELREILDMMEAAVKKLDEFIKNTHEYYTLKSTGTVLEQIEFDKLLKDVATLFKIGGKIENINFETEVIQNEVFFSDEIAIKIILNNLLSNAFKYQRRNAGDKYVALKIVVAGNKVTMVVKDNGIGISDSHIDNIFTMFYRATSEESGSGFGLYNVKDALSRLNGIIEVQSKINEGSTFTVVIPGKSNDAQ